jgi:glycogen operon protein
LTWLAPGGKEMTDEEWSQSFARCLGVFLSGHGLTEHDAHGHPVADDDLLLLLNAHHDEIPFTLPGEPNVRWNALTDTSAADGTPPRISFQAGTPYPLQGRSVALLNCKRGQ